MRVASRKSSRAEANYLSAAAVIDHFAFLEDLGLEKRPLSAKSLEFVRSVHKKIRRDAWSQYPAHFVKPLQERKMGALHDDQVNIRPQMHRAASQGTKHNDPFKPRTIG